MEISLGIPDDTPENIAKSITEIIRGEASRLGVDFKLTSERKNLACEVTIRVTQSPKYFQILLNYIESQDLEKTYATIGSGFVSWGLISGPPKRLDLELLAKDWLHPLSRPFRWAVYEEGKNSPEAPPLYILDGNLLRQWLRQFLPSAPPSSS